MATRNWFGVCTRCVGYTGEWLCLKRDSLWNPVLYLGRLTAEILCKNKEVWKANGTITIQIKFGIEIRIGGW